MHQTLRMFLLGLVVVAAHAADPGAPSLTSGGSVRCGDKELRLGNGHIVYTVDGRKLMDIYPCWGWPAGGYGEGGYGDAEGRQEIDAAGRSVSYHAVVKGRTDAQKQAAYACSMTLADDGIVRCRIASPRSANSPASRWCRSASPV